MMNVVSCVVPSAVLGFKNSIVNDSQEGDISQQSQGTSRGYLYTLGVHMATGPPRGKISMQ